MAGHDNSYGRYEGRGSPVFATTRWSEVFAAVHPESPHAPQALEQLCVNYWYPLYAYVRRQGHDSHEAQDLTQSFFLRLIEKRYLSLADPSRGKFRSFLLTSLKHFLVNEWEKSRTAKRGGGDVECSWDARDAESRYLAEPADEATPDRVYEKRWAATLIDNVLAQLRAEFTAAGKLALFDELKGHVWGTDVVSYADAASRLKTSEGALRIAAHRMRDDFRRLLRQEVARTVATPGEIDEELRHLIDVLRN